MYIRKIIRMRMRISFFAVPSKTPTCNHKTGQFSKVCAVTQRETRICTEEVSRRLWAASVQWEHKPKKQVSKELLPRSIPCPQWISAHTCNATSGVKAFLPKNQKKLATEPHSNLENMDLNWLNAFEIHFSSMLLAKARGSFPLLPPYSKMHLSKMFQALFEHISHWVCPHHLTWSCSCFSLPGRL